MTSRWLSLCNLVTDGIENAALPSDGPPVPLLFREHSLPLSRDGCLLGLPLRPHPSSQLRSRQKRTSGRFGDGPVHSNASTNTFIMCTVSAIIFAISMLKSDHVKNEHRSSSSRAIPDSDQLPFVFWLQCGLSLFVFLFVFWISVRAVREGEMWDVSRVGGRGGRPILFVT